VAAVGKRALNHVFYISVVNHIYAIVMSTQYDYKLALTHTHDPNLPKRVS